jgi:hypothetical protein
MADNEDDLVDYDEEEVRSSGIFDAKQWRRRNEWFTNDKGKPRRTHQRVASLKGGF